MATVSSDEISLPSLVWIVLWNNNLEFFLMLNFIIKLLTWSMKNAVLLSIMFIFVSVLFICLFLSFPKLFTPSYLYVYVPLYP